MAGAGVPSGGRREQLVHILDVFPTVADVAGVNVEHAKAPLDGRSIWPVIQDDEAAAAEFIFVEKFFPTAREANWQALRDERYKIVRSDDGYQALFDLQGRTDDGPNLLDRVLTASERARYTELQTQLALMLGTMGAPPDIL